MVYCFRLIHKIVLCDITETIYKSYTQNYNIPCYKYFTTSITYEIVQIYMPIKLIFEINLMNLRYVKLLKFNDLFITKKRKKSILYVQREKFVRVFFKLSLYLLLFLSNSFSKDVH